MGMMTAHTRAFCLGVERQHITDEQLIARSKNESSKFLLRANDNDLPSIIKPKEIELPLDKRSCEFPSLICFDMLTLKA